MLTVDGIAVNLLVFSFSEMFLLFSSSEMFLLFSSCEMLSLIERETALGFRGIYF